MFKTFEFLSENCFVSCSFIGSGTRKCGGLGGLGGLKFVSDSFSMYWFEIENDDNFFKFRSDYWFYY